MMTNGRKQEYTGTLPERFGGSFLFRARYLESSWVKFIFRTLVYAAAVMLIMTAVAGKVSQWQTEYREHSLTRIETELTFLSGRQTTAELAGDLTGQADALSRQITLLQQQQELLNTACVYLLDCDSSVTRTAQALFLHINTIKYRLQRISDLLGYRLGKMPETIELYRSAAIYRLLHAQHEA